MPKMCYNFRLKVDLKIALNGGAKDEDLGRTTRTEPGGCGYRGAPDFRPGASARPH